jgi:hypothetical protein
VRNLSQKLELPLFRHLRGDHGSDDSVLCLSCIDADRNKMKRPVELDRRMKLDRCIGLIVVGSIDRFIITVSSTYHFYLPIHCEHVWWSRSCSKLQLLPSPAHFSPLLIDTQSSSRRCTASRISPSHAYRTYEARQVPDRFVTALAQIRRS